MRPFFAAVPRPGTDFVAAVLHPARLLLGAALQLLLAGIVFGASPVGAQGGTTTPRVSAPSQGSVARTRSVRAEALPSRVDYVPRGRYDELRDYIVRSRATGGTLFNSPDGQTNYMIVRRTTASDVEEHSRWDDLIIVRSGTGTVEVGPRATGARFLAAGELRGGTITAPSRLDLRPGDIARIPAGVPHAFSPSGAEPWEFLLVKVRRPGKPLRRPPGAAK